MFHDFTLSTVLFQISHCLINHNQKIYISEWIKNQKLFYYQNWWVKAINKYQGNEEVLPIIGSLIGDKEICHRCYNHLLIIWKINALNILIIITYYYEIEMKKVKKINYHISLQNNRLQKLTFHSPFYAKKNTYQKWSLKYNLPYIIEISVSMKTVCP